MENRKIRVAITQGDANGVGLEMIFKTFMEPEMLELCTPVIYTSPKVASYHSKALNLHCQYSIVSKVEDVKADRVNLLVCYEDDLKVEFGQPTPESALLAVRSVTAAYADYQKGLIDVLVCGPIVDRILQFSPTEQIRLADYIRRIVDKEKKSIDIYDSDILRLAVASHADVRDVAAALTKENIKSIVASLHTTLRRDFRIDNPRIAMLTLNLRESLEEREVLHPLVDELTGSDVQLFGPYRSDEFFASQGFTAFDIVLCMHYEQAMLPLRMLTDKEVTVVKSGLPIVCVTPHTDAQMAIAGRGKANENLLRRAIYTAIDIFRARADYDEAIANPLEKRYKERSDNGQ